MAQSLINVLIVGRSGNGKSSIGYSILKAKMFDTSAISEENKPHLKSVNGNGFSVIECSCIKDEEEYSEHDFEVAGEAIRNFENRTDVILFVMKYGVRYTQQEKHAVERLRTIFGETVFRDWVVICFSYGDNFEKDKQENDNDFETWCWAQSGAVQTLFKEVEYRIVLFNNKAELLESTEQELNKFIRIIVHRNHDQHKELKELVRLTRFLYHGSEFFIRFRDIRKGTKNNIIGDTGDDISYKIGDIQEATRKMLQHLVTTGGSGIDAIVFVLKYGVRFTKQEKDAVTRVKEIFGDNVFSDFGIIAFSYGDLFDLDNSSQKIEFDDWCLQQSGYVKALFIECDYRCVLFNNKNTLGDTLQRQNTNLWECVATKYFENKKTSVQSCVDEAGKEMATKKDCAEETNKVNVTDENCDEETNKVNVTDENCDEETNKVNVTDENCAAETNKVNVTDENCAEETNKVNITDENCAEETNKVNITDENCDEETNKVNVTDENCAEETNKVNVTDENCAEETNKVNVTDENCAEETNKVNITDENCAAETNKVNVTDENCAEETNKVNITDENCDEETNKVNITDENCAEETNKVNVTDENCAEETKKVNITDENCAEETNKVNVTDENCAEETNKVNITDENCAEETNKVNITDENCDEETNKVNITDENCDEETNKVNITDENCDEETNKVNITDENCAVNTEVVKEEITMNETEESYDFITEEEILEADGKQTTNVNVTGKDFALVTRNKNTEIGDSALKHPKENTGNENTMQGNENEVRKDDKDIKEPESEYKEKRKITRKYTISDFDNRKHVPRKENNKINDTPTNSCSFLSCFSLRST
nr:AIG Resistant factor [Biomphalaria glabrata]